jgi:precorrin-6Y C5,15-methyltransferase (decarboxylating)
MSDPWLTIVGLGEDGLAGLSDASRAAIAGAEVIFGGPRHLALVGARARGRVWPVPFRIDPVLVEKGRKVVVLASGDPFWFGAGGSLSRALNPAEWRVCPAPSAFSLAAARLGWPLETCVTHGLHARPFASLLPDLTPGRRALCLMRDGAAVGDLARWLTDQGFGPSRLHILEHLGGPQERHRTTQAQAYDLPDVAAPVLAAIEVDGAPGLPATPGLPDDLFASDGVMTKRAVRALTLSALAPRAGQLLWDLGAGSGSVSVEWALAAPGGRAVAIESRADRLANILANLARFGLEARVQTFSGNWADQIAALPPPDAIFIGGGADRAGIETVLPHLHRFGRLVVNAVTLETQQVVTEAQAAHGGELLKIDLAEAAPLGRLRGWQAARTVVQWSLTR